MGASLWDQVWLPLLIGIVIQIVVAALCFLSARLWKCLTKQIKTQIAVDLSNSKTVAALSFSVQNDDKFSGVTSSGRWTRHLHSYGPQVERVSPPFFGVGGSAHDQPLPESDAAAPGNVVPDLEMGNGCGPAEGGQSMPEPELELGIVNGGEGIDYFSDEEAHTPVIKFAVITPKAQFTRDAARGAPVPVEMDFPHSKQEEAAE